jgi:hypothetical protein
MEGLLSPFPYREAYLRLRSDTEHQNVYYCPERKFYGVDLNGEVIDSHPVYGLFFDELTTSIAMELPVVISLFVEDVI